MHTSSLDSCWSLPVLTYHHIGEPTCGLEPTITVSPRCFQDQISWLKRKDYTTITAAQLYDVLQRRAVMPPRPVLLTFDDGYADLCEHALPALTTLGFTGTVFVVTGRLGQTNTWDEARGWSSLSVMSADQICHWAARGIDFGAHSQTHPNLTRVSDAELAAELAGSAQELGRLLRRAVTCFSYPHGAQNARVRAAAARYFDLAFGGEEGLNRAGADPTRIRRTMVRPADGPPAFSHRVVAGRSPFYDLRQWRARVRLRSRAWSVLKWFRSA